MGQLVMSFGNAHHLVAELAPFPGEHAGRHWVYVSRECEDHQVAHQVEVFREVGRHRFRSNGPCGGLDRR